MVRVYKKFREAKWRFKIVIYLTMTMKMKNGCLIRLVLSLFPSLSLSFPLFLFVIFLFIVTSAIKIENIDNFTIFRYSCILLADYKLRAKNKKRLRIC